MPVPMKIDKRRKYVRFLPFISIILIFAAVLVLKFVREPRDQEIVSQLPSLPQTPVPQLEERQETIRKGMTLAEILAKHGFSPAEVHKLKEEVKPVYNLGKIQAGHELRLFSAPGGEIARFEYDIDDQKLLSVSREGTKFSAEVQEFPFEIETEMIWGVIEDNLILAFERKREKDLLALALADLFAWDVDFYTDLRQGDTFRLVFEKKFLKGDFAGYGNILAAEIINQGKTFQAFRYTYPDTKKSDYFDPEAGSLRKELYKSPIKFARITSRYSSSRLHPIRKVYGPHYGIDYAAPVGTPVQSTADGTVVFAGWNGASGRMVSIKHGNGYETMYLHLRSYSQGIKKGAKVAQGQIIGFVGSSGESTGPHLDYRIKLRGSYINPLGWRFKPVEPIRPEYLEDYEKQVEKFRALLDLPLIIFKGFSLI